MLSDQKESLGEAWQWLRLGLKEIGQVWLLVAEWADAEISLLLCV